MLIQKKITIFAQNIITDGNRRNEIAKDIPEIYNILKKGSEVAREEAAKTISEVKAAMKINYCDDAALIAGQADKYAQE